MGSSSYRQAGREAKQKMLASRQQVPKHRSSKDTKRWCKGVEGREHQWTFEEWKHSRSFKCNPPVTVELCKNCRREKGTVGRRWWWNSKAYGPAF